MKRKVLATAAVLAALFLTGCATSKDSILPPGQEAVPKPAQRQKPRRQAAPPAEAKVPAAARESSVEEVADAPAVTDAALASPEASAAPPAPAWEGVPPLSLASRDWPVPDGPFREAANAARRHLADGDPEAAARAAGNAMKAAASFDEKAESKALASAAAVLAGRSQGSVTAGLDRPSDDWKALETARAGMSGPLPEARVREAFDEVRGWPSPAAARVLPWLAAAAGRSPALAAEILAHAERLDASGLLGEAELALVRGYAASAAGDREGAAEAFTQASSSSPLRVVSARAAVEAAEAGVEGLAERAAGMRTGDETERRALRMLVSARGPGWRAAAERLAEIAADPKERSVMLAAAKEPDPSVSGEAVAAGPADPVEKGDESLLAEESADEESGISVMKAAEAAISEADRLIESFPSRNR